MTRDADDQKESEGEAAWRAIEPVWESISIYGTPQEFMNEFNSVHEPIGHLFAVHWCNSEVCNGGFHQFFSNPTGILAPEARDGFRALGLTKCAEILEEALSIIGATYPRDREMRNWRLKQLKREGKKRADWDPFYSLDDQYYKAKNDSDLYGAMDRYAKENVG